MKRFNFLLLAALLVSAAACNGTGTANSADNEPPANDTAATASTDTMAQNTATASNDATQNTAQLVQSAANVVTQMKSDSDLARLMQKAKGVFIVPEYGKGALVVGARGGEGVLLAKNGRMWSDPAFYDIGAVSFGPQIGGGGGPVAMLLMTDKAVNSFKGGNNFSFNANAGFTIVDYNARAQGSVGKGDVVLWSNIQGAFAGASLGVSDINFNDGDNKAYYGVPTITAEQILTNKVTAPASASSLQQTLPA
ncbi:MAG TPA: lipid-binding SYLF domain-containing protein [Thermoanaerobaculia bacterium]|nr:lipid-binding SYLF domain-containing protein [Thermoanaerobaculia bacterium]